MSYNDKIIMKYTLLDKLRNIQFRLLDYTPFYEINKFDFKFQNCIQEGWRHFGLVIYTKKFSKFYFIAIPHDVYSLRTPYPYKMRKS